MDRYDAGLLGDAGGGNVAWWQDYLRAELDRADDFYRDQYNAEILKLTALCDEYKGEVDRLQGIVTALEEGCHSCQHPKRVDELTCQKNALQQVVGERDAEIERLKESLGRIAHTVWWLQEDQLRATGSINGMDGASAVAMSMDYHFLRSIAERALAGAPVGVSAESALTRARAEGMEEAFEEAAKVVGGWPWANVALYGEPELEKIAAAIRAAKGEQ